MALTFILSDGSVNSYGFRLDVNKMDLARFKENPVMLYNHKELIGKWENIRVEGDKLMADANFMDADNEDLALKIKNRVEKGYLKGASLGIGRPKDVVYEENKAPLVVSEVSEASIVDVPSNANALKMYDDNGIELSGDSLQLSLNSILNQSKKDTEMKLSAESYKTLGLESSAGDEAINTAIGQLAADKKTAEEKLENIQKAEISGVLSAAKKDGKITKENEAQFETMLKNDLEGGKKIIEMLPGKKNLSGKEQPADKGGNEDRSGWDFEKWRKEDTPGLLNMKTNDPEAYEELRKTQK